MSGKRPALAPLLLLLTALAIPTIAARVVQLEWQGSVDFGTLGYLGDAFAELESQGVDLVVLRLDSRDGGLYPLRQLRRLFEESPFEIAVWVAPTGASLAGNSLLLGWSADYLFGAPGATFGSARPLSVGPDGRLLNHGVEGLSARGLELITELPPRIDPGWARLLLAGYQEFTPRQMMHRGLGDGTAANLNDLATLAGHPITPIETERRETALLWRGLSYIAEPTIAFLLYLFALLSFTLAGTQRGGYFSLALGLGFLISAVIAFIYLPINATGLILVPLGVLAVVIDKAIRARGVAALLGLGALLTGGLLFYEPAEVLVAPALLLPVVAALALFYLFINSGSLFNRLLDGGRRVRGLLSRWGVAVEEVRRPRIGWIMIDDELWPARFRRPARRGQPVQVVDLQRCRLVVTPLSGDDD